MKISVYQLLFNCLLCNLRASRKNIKKSVILTFEFVFSMLYAYLNCQEISASFLLKGIYLPFPSLYLGKIPFLHLRLFFQNELFFLHSLSGKITLTYFNTYVRFCVLSGPDFYTRKVDTDMQELWSVLYLIFTVNVFHNQIFTLPLPISQFTTNEHFFFKENV